MNLNKKLAAVAVLSAAAFSAPAMAAEVTLFGNYGEVPAALTSGKSDVTRAQVAAEAAKVQQSGARLSDLSWDSMGPDTLQLPATAKSRDEVRKEAQAIGSDAIQRRMEAIYAQPSRG